MFKRTTLALAAAALLGGCYYSPQEIRETQAPREFTSTRPLAQAANCIARNAEAIGGFISATVRTEGSTAEVLARVVSSGTPFAMADLEQSGPTVRGKLWVSPHSFTETAREERRDQLLKGC